MVALGRMRSMCRSSKTQALIDTARHVAEMTVVRRLAVIAVLSALAPAKSFQVPALENQNRAAQGHRRIEHGIERVVQDQLPTDRLLMRDRADHVQRREI